METTHPDDAERTYELTDEDLQEIWTRAEVIALDGDDEAREDALEILSIIHDQLGMGQAAMLNARADKRLLKGDDHDDRLRTAIHGDDLVDRVDNHLDDE